MQNLYRIVEAGSTQLDEIETKGKISKKDFKANVIKKIAGSGLNSLRINNGNYVSNVSDEGATVTIFGDEPIHIFIPKTKDFRKSLVKGIAGTRYLGTEKEVNAVVAATEDILNREAKTVTFYDTMIENYYEEVMDEIEFYTLCIVMNYSKYSEIKMNKQKIFSYFKNQYAYHRGYKYNVEICMRGVLNGSN